MSKTADEPSLARQISMRLKKARRDAGFLDAAEAARAYSYNVSTYRSHENGTRGIPIGIAREYADAFGVLFAWLMTGEGQQRLFRNIPAIGLLNANGKIDTASGDSISFRVDFDDAIIGEFRSSIIYVILEDSLEPRYSYGDVIFVDNEPSSIYFNMPSVEALVVLNADATEMIFGIVDCPQRPQGRTQEDPEVHVRPLDAPEHPVVCRPHSIYVTQLAVRSRYARMRVVSRV